MDTNIPEVATINTENDINSSSAVESDYLVSFDKLQQAVEKSVKRVTSRQRVIPYIKEQFRKVYRADSESVLEIYKSMMNQLESMIMEDIQMQLQACNVEELLGSLDKIKLESVSSQRKWRPSGSPKEDVKAHLQETSQKELQQLEKVFRSLKSQNVHLNECVAKCDEKLQESLKMLEDYCSSWEEAALVISDETKDKLIDMNMDLSSKAM